MATSDKAFESKALSPVDSRIYGVVWLGLAAAAVGVVLGLLMALSADSSSLVGVAVMTLSIAAGAITYLVRKVLDRL